MSGIAEILRLQGYIVSGCDKDINSNIINHLRDIGCIIYKDHDKTHINDADVLVYSSAVHNDNPEVIEAINKNIPVIPRAKMLAEIMRMKHGIAVTGAHGKTTTTSMISHILLEANYDPTIIIGGVLKSISLNAKLGKSDILIAEADESDRSFLFLSPCIAVVTNIDLEHLDTYKDLDDIKNTFKNFLERLPFFGKAILCIDNENIRSMLPLPDINIIKYGVSDDADITCEVLELNKANSVYNVYLNNKNIYKKPKFLLGQITLNVPGHHNILNSLAAIALALELELSFEKIKNALETFKGVERRFEFKGTCNGAEIFDDYGHHPTEIYNTLLIAQKRANKNLHVIFQPHRFTRTQKLWQDFVNVFSQNTQIKTLYITDIYPASETPIEGINSYKLAQDIQAQNKNIKVIYYPDYASITKDVQNILQDNDLLLTIGAGRVNLIAQELAGK